MPFRFRRSVRIAPGVRLNIGKRGASFSVGGRGSSMTFGSRGVYSNVGIPGTGLSYRSRIAGTSSTSQNRAATRSAAPAMMALSHFGMSKAISCQMIGSV